MNRGTRQKEILTALKEDEAVCIRWLSSIDAEYKALLRAAHNLEDDGEVELFRVWTEGADGRGLPMVWAFRPGITPQDLDGYHEAVTRYESRTGVGTSEIPRFQHEREKDNGDPGGRDVEGGRNNQVQRCFKGCQGCGVTGRGLFSPQGKVFLCYECWSKAGQEYVRSELQ